MMAPGYGYIMGGYSWIGMLLMFIFGVLVIAGIVLLIVWAIRSSTGRGAGSGGTGSAGSDGADEAMGIARRRLADGEITNEQYAEIMRTLNG